MKSVENICASFTKKLEKVLASQQNAAQDKLHYAESLRNDARIAEQQADVHIKEAKAATTAITNIKNLFGLSTK